jgi:hypothetical protein
VIFRIPLLIVAIAAVAGALAIDRPERFAITSIAGFLTILLAAGAIAADAVPLRRVQIVCGAVALVAGFGLLGRADIHLAISVSLVALHLVGLGADLALRRRKKILAEQKSTDLGADPRLDQPRSEPT